MNGSRGFRFEVSQYLSQPQLFETPEWHEVSGARMYHLMRLENLEQMLARVFARSKAVLGDDTWLELIEHFHVSWPCIGQPSTLLYEEFVAFAHALPEVDDVPAWLADLVRFEWILWSVSARERQLIQMPCAEDVLDLDLMINASLREELFDWSVHEISELFQPEEPMRTVLWVLRDDSDDVQVVRGDLFGSQLLGLIRQGVTPRQALSSMARWFDHENPQAFVREASMVISRLVQEKVLVRI